MRCCIRGPWVRTEVLPLSIGDARWVVNWSEHLLGGGITYRSLVDWYALHGVPAPKVFAAVTSLSAAAMNEVTEFPNETRASSSTVADLWIFDLGSVLLFSWDSPVAWVAEHLHLANWSTMPAITLPNGELQNNGEYFVLKAPLPKVDQQLMVRFGLGVQFGVTTPVDEERSFSAALGLDTRGRHVDPETGRESIDMLLGGGVYYDRNDSLLGSFTMSAAANKFSLNLYPGLFGGPLRDVGFWAVFPLERQPRFGLASRHLLGVGLGYGQDR
jgi:hypothetical protein